MWTCWRNGKGTRFVHWATQVLVNQPFLTLLTDLKEYGPVHHCFLTCILNRSASWDQSVIQHTYICSNSFNGIVHAADVNRRRYLEIRGGQDKRSWNNCVRCVAASQQHREHEAVTVRILSCIVTWGRKGIISRLNSNFQHKVKSPAAAIPLTFHAIETLLHNNSSPAISCWTSNSCLKCDLEANAWQRTLVYTLNKLTLYLNSKLLWLFIL